MRNLQPVHRSVENCRWPDSNRHGPFTAQRILSPLRLPSRHIGACSLDFKHFTRRTKTNFALAEGASARSLAVFVLSLWDKAFCRMWPLSRNGLKFFAACCVIRNKEMLPPSSDADRRGISPRLSSAILRRGRTVGVTKIHPLAGDDSCLFSQGNPGFIRI